MEITLKNLQRIVNSQLCITGNGKQYFGKLISYTINPDDKSEITYINIASGLGNIHKLDVKQIEDIEEIATLDEI